MKRPSTFKDWRAIYHAEAMSLGWLVLYAFDGHRVPMSRDLWQSIHRLRRIRLRLDVEAEVKDLSFYEAMFEMLAREIRNRD